MLPENGLEMIAQNEGNDKFEVRAKLLSEIAPELGQGEDPLERIKYVLECLKSAENLSG